MHPWRRKQPLPKRKLHVRKSVSKEKDKETAQCGCQDECLGLRKRLNCLLFSNLLSACITCSTLCRTSHLRNVAYSSTTYCSKSRLWVTRFRLSRHSLRESEVLKTERLVSMTEKQN